MLKSAIVRIVDFCTRYPWWVLALALILSAASAVYAARHFAIRTDINELISNQLPWTQRATEYMAAFPQREILVVIDAPTPELVEQAATRLADALQGRRDLVRVVPQPQSRAFFQRAAARPRRHQRDRADRRGSAPCRGLPRPRAPNWAGADRRRRIRHAQAERRPQRHRLDPGGAPDPVAGTAVVPDHFRGGGEH